MNKRVARTWSLLLAMAMIVVACGTDAETTTTTAGSGEDPVSCADSGVDAINLLTWDGYHAQEWVDEWTAETGVTVNVTNVGSPAEMFSKVKATPAQFDIAYVTAGWYENYVAEDLVIPIDESRVPGIGQISDVFPWRDATSVDGVNYGVLYAWGDQPLGWNLDAIPGDYDIDQYLNDAGEVDDWNILWDPQFEGRVTIFDDPTSVQPMIALALGFEDPFNLTDEEFEQFSDKLMELRPQVRKLTTGYDDQVTTLVTEEAILGYINIGQVIVDVNAAGVPLAASHTVSQGVPAWSDNATITAQGGANKLDCVYDFIDANIQPGWQARFTKETGGTGTLSYDQAIEEGLTDEELAVTLIPQTQLGDAFFESMVFFKQVEDLDARLELWNEFKLGIGG
jgi:spermidine/putrescine-binding protein